jgi:hypothetical protein
MAPHESDSGEEDNDDEVITIEVRGNAIDATSCGMCCKECMMVDIVFQQRRC